MSEVSASVVAAQLGELGRSMDAVTEQLEIADKAAVGAREDYTMAYARAFLQAEGSAEARKQMALLATHQARLDQETADQMVRGLRRRLDSVRTRIDVGRTISATVRSEVSLSATGAWGK